VSFIVGTPLDDIGALSGDVVLASARGIIPSTLIG
jgi:hypothetical protein